MTTLTQEKWFPVNRRSMADYQIEQVGPSGFAEVEALYNANYPWKTVPAGFARWRYASRDVRGICLGIRQASQDRLVAAYGLGLLPAVEAADSLLVGLVSDVVVHPAYQRQGLGSQLEQAVVGYAHTIDCDFLLCFPNPRLAALHAKSDAWVTETETRAFVRSAASPLGVSPAAKVRHAAQAPAGVETLWQMLRDRGSLAQGFVRGEAFLNWRFRQHPRNQYEFLSWHDENRLRGYAVVKVWVDPFTHDRCGDIADLLADDDETTLALLAAACRRLSQHAVSHYTLWAPPPLGDDTLRHLGFERDPCHIRQAQVRNIKRSTRVPLANWFLTQADTDIY